MTSITELVEGYVITFIDVHAEPSVTVCQWRPRTSSAVDYRITAMLLSHYSRMLITFWSIHCQHVASPSNLMSDSGMDSDKGLYEAINRRVVLCLRKELRNEDFSAECRSTDAVDVSVINGKNICIRVPTQTSNWVGSQGREDGMVRIEKPLLGQGMERDEWREKKRKVIICLCTSSRLKTHQVWREISTQSISGTGNPSLN